MSQPEKINVPLVPFELSRRWIDKPAEKVNYGDLWGFPPGYTVKANGPPVKRSDGSWELRFTVTPPADEPVIVEGGA